MMVMQLVVDLMMVMQCSPLDPIPSSLASDIGLWYLPDSPSISRSSVYDLIRSRSKKTRSAADVCNNGDDMLSYAHRLGDSTPIRDKCCIRDRYWPVSED